MFNVGNQKKVRKKKWDKISYLFLDFIVRSITVIPTINPINKMGYPGIGGGVVSIIGYTSVITESRVLLLL